MKAIPVNRNDEYTIGKIVFIAQEKDSRPITPLFITSGVISITPRTTTVGSFYLSRPWMPLFYSPL